MTPLTDLEAFVRDHRRTAGYGRRDAARVERLSTDRRLRVWRRVRAVQTPDGPGDRPHGPAVAPATGRTSDRITFARPADLQRRGHRPVRDPSEHFERRAVQTRRHRHR